MAIQRGRAAVSTPAWKDGRKCLTSDTFNVFYHHLVNRNDGGEIRDEDVVKQSTQDTHRQLVRFDCFVSTYSPEDAPIDFAFWVEGLKQVDDFLLVSEYAVCNGRFIRCHFWLFVL